MCSTLTKGTFSSRLLLSNQDKGCTPSVAHSLPLPPGFCATCHFRVRIRIRVRVRIRVMDLGLGLGLGLGVRVRVRG